MRAGIHGHMRGHSTVSTRYEVFPFGNGRTSVSVGRSPRHKSRQGKTEGGRMEEGCQMSQSWMSNDEGQGEIKHDASMTGDHTKRYDIARQEMTVRWSGPRSRLEKGPARHGESRARAFRLCMGMGTHTHTGRTQATGQGRAGGLETWKRAGC